MAHRISPTTLALTAALLAAPLAVHAQTYTVTFQTDGTAGASLTGTTSQDVPEGASTTAVTAVPPTDWKFLSWTGTGGFITDVNPVVVTNVSQPMTVTANFVRPTGAYLTSSADPTSADSPVQFTVTLNPATATGAVQFRVDGVALGSPVAVSGGTALSIPVAITAAGAHEITASFDGSGQYVDSTGWLSQDVTPGAPASFTVAPGSSGQSATVGGAAFANPLGVTLRDAWDNVVPGATVFFAAPMSGASASLAISPATTDALGQASVTATPNTAAGTYAVSVSSGAAETTVTLTNAPGAAETLAVTPSASGQTRVVGGPAFTNPLEVTLRDVYLNTVPGAPVTYAAPVTGASATLLTSPTTTDAFGVARVVATPNTVAGTYSVTVASGSTSGSFTLTNAPGPAATLAVTAGASGQTRVVGGAAFANPLQVTVRDTYGNPVPGAPVIYTAPASGASATLVTSPTTTNASGVASVVASPNTLAGTYSVTVASGSAGGSFTLTNAPGPAATLLVTAGASGQTATVGGPAFANPLQVTVRDTYSNPVPGATVVYTVPVGGASAFLATSPTTTNPSGVASVVATPNTVAGTYSVTVVSGAASGSVTLTNAPGAAADIAVTAGASGQSATVGGPAFANPLEVTVTDTFGNAVPGASVSYAAPASGASATFATSPATTNVSGVASVVATPNTVAGGYLVTVSSGAAGPASIALTNLHGAAQTFTAVSGGSQHTTVADDFPVALAVSIVDAYGNGVPGIQVDLAVPPSGATATLSASSVATGGAGQASVTATAGTVTGSYQVVASASGLSDVTFALTNDPGAPAAIAAGALATPQTAQVGGSAFANPLGVVVTDTYGNGVPGVTVTWSEPAPERAVLSALTAQTGAAGTADVTATTGSLAGGYSVTASIAGGLSATFSLANTLGAPGALLLVAGDAQHATVDAPFAAQLEVRVEDVLGNPMPGVLVSFDPPTSGATAILSATGLATDAAGHAVVTATAGTVAGAYQVAVSAEGVTAPVAFSLVNDPGAPASVIPVALSTPQSSAVTTAYAHDLAVTVRDVHDNPVPGVEVTWTAPSSGATVALSAAAATTDAAGFAAVSATAGDVAGAVVVNASVTGVSTPAAFALTNLSGAAGSIAVVSGTPQQAVVGATFGAALEVVVRDALGNAVPGATVDFAAPATGARASLSAPSAQTGADGHASVTATAGTVAGAYQVTASVAGAAGAVQFALTNQPGAPASVVAGASSSGQSSRVGEAFASALAVTVTDAQGNPLPGVTVAFACPATGPTCTLAAPSVVTNAQGQAQVVATAGTVPGTLSATATVTGLTPASFALTNLVGLPGSIATVSGAAQSAQVLQAFGAPLVVVVKDGFQNVVAGVTVTFAVVSTGDQGAVLSAASAVTGATGQASVTATANGATGAYSVSATAAGAAAPAVFGLTNTEAPKQGHSGGGGCSTGGAGSASLIPLLLLVLRGVRGRRRER